MKIWQSFGSEHSSNLVMIGHFKNVADAQEAQKLIEILKEGLKDKSDIGNYRERYDDEIWALLKRANCYSLAPYELEQFQFDFSTQLDDNKIILTTDEYEVSGFFMLMINNGAKVEIFSAHDYPDAEFGRGK